MALNETLETAYATGSLLLASTPHSLLLLPDTTGSADENTLMSDILLLSGLMLTLLATFALAISHASQPWRNISIFLNGIALACGAALLAGELQLVTVPAESLEILQAGAGLFAILAVLLLWPALSGLGRRSAEPANALPLAASPQGPLSLEDALTGSGVTIFARSTDLSERWSIPHRPGSRVANALPASLLKHIEASLQKAFGRNLPVIEQVRIEDARDQPRWYELSVHPGQFSDGQSGAIGLAQDVTRYRKAEADCRHLLQESTHRTKNLLTIIQSVARMSAKTLGLPPGTVEPFNARLQSIAMSYDLLVRENWTAVPLTDLLHSQLNHALGTVAARVNYSGPPLRLRPTAVQTLALAIHELAVKAREQGALATPSGRLRITWEEAAMRDDSPGFRLIWQEVGPGPAVMPEHRNYARDILERLTPRGLRGEVAATQPKEGFRWELRFPASNVLTQPEC